MQAFVTKYITQKKQVLTYRLRFKYQNLPAEYKVQTQTHTYQHFV